MDARELADTVWELFSREEQYQIDRRMAKGTPYDPWLEEDKRSLMSAEQGRDAALLSALLDKYQKLDVSGRQAGTQGGPMDDKLADWAKRHCKFAQDDTPQIQFPLQVELFDSSSDYGNITITGPDGKWQPNGFLKWKLRPQDIQEILQRAEYGPNAEGQTSNFLFFKLNPKPQQQPQPQGVPANMPPEEGGIPQPRAYAANWVRKNCAFAKKKDKKEVETAKNDKTVSEEKFKRCKEHVKENSPGVNEYAVCTDSMGGQPASYHKKKEKASTDEATKQAAIGLPEGRTWPHRKRDATDEEYERRKKKDPKTDWDKVWREKAKDKKKAEDATKGAAGEASTEFEKACNM